LGFSFVLVVRTLAVFLAPLFMAAADLAFFALRLLREPLCPPAIFIAFFQQEVIVNAKSRRRRFSGLFFTAGPARDTAG
jgi:hypothetical protein